MGARNAFQNMHGADRDQSRFTSEEDWRFAVEVLGGIDLDPCAHPGSGVNASVRVILPEWEEVISRREVEVRAPEGMIHYGCGVEHPWEGLRVFCNPPWGNMGPFFEKRRTAHSCLFLVPLRPHRRFWVWDWDVVIFPTPRCFEPYEESYSNACVFLYCGPDPQGVIGAASARGWEALPMWRLRCKPERMTSENKPWDGDYNTLLESWSVAMESLAKLSPLAAAEALGNTAGEVMDAADFLSQEAGDNVRDYVLNLPILEVEEGGGNKVPETASLREKRAKIAAQEKAKGSSGKRQGPKGGRGKKAPPRTVEAPKVAKKKAAPDAPGRSIPVKEATELLREKLVPKMNGEPVKIGDVMSKFDLNRQTAGRAMKALVGEGELRLEGVGRAAAYKRPE